MMRASIIFPLSLVVLMAGVSFWLDNISQIHEKVKPLDPTKPEFIATGVKAKRFDELGFLKEYLIAKRIWQFPKSNEIYLETPNIDVYSLGIMKYQLSSKDGRYNDKTKQAYFEQRVVLDRLPESNHPATQIITTKLNIDTITGIAQSKEKVDFSYGDSKGSAIGFLYNEKTGFLNLNSRVSAIYEVPQQP